MSKFKIKLEDFESFINGLGYEILEDVIGYKQKKLTGEIIKSQNFSIYILKDKKVKEIGVYVDPITLYVNYDNLFDGYNTSSRWRKHLANIYGKEYSDFLKKYCENKKSFYKNVFDENLNSIDEQIKKLTRKKEIKTRKYNENIEKYNEILADIENNDLTM